MIWAEIDKAAKGEFMVNCLSGILVLRAFHRLNDFSLTCETSN